MTEEGGNVPEKFVPIREREVSSDQLKPELQCFPNMCKETREKLYKWYPGPTILMHKMHWTEYIFATFLAVAILLMVLGADKIPAQGWGGLLIAIGAVSLFFFWGFAKYKSLAELAEKLEKLAEQNHREVGLYGKINDEWEKGIAESGANIKDFAAKLGLIEDDANKIAEVEAMLSSLVGQKRKLMKAQRACHEVSERHARVVQRQVLERGRDNLKDEVEDAFERVDDNHKLGGRSDNCITGDEIPALKELLNKIDYLNQRDDDGNLKFDWASEFEEMQADGTIHKYELFDALDRVTQSYFLEIRDAISHTSKLEKELEMLKNKLEAKGINTDHVKIEVDDEE